MTKRPLVQPEALEKPPATDPAEGKKWEPSPGTSPMIGARVDKALRADFEAIAKKEGLYLSDLLRWLIRNFIKDYKAGRVELPKKPREPEAPYTLE